MKYKIAPVIYQREVLFTVYVKNWLGLWTKPLIYHSTFEAAEKQMMLLLTPSKFLTGAPGPEGMNNA